MISLQWFTSKLYIQYHCYLCVINSDFISHRLDYDFIRNSRILIYLMLLLLLSWIYYFEYRTYFLIIYLFLVYFQWDIFVSINCRLLHHSFIICIRFYLLDISIQFSFDFHLKNFSNYIVYFCMWTRWKEYKPNHTFHLTYTSITYVRFRAKISSYFPIADKMMYILI